MSKRFCWLIRLLPLDGQGCYIIAECILLGLATIDSRLTDLPSLLYMFLSLHWNCSGQQWLTLTMLYTMSFTL